MSNPEGIGITPPIGNTEAEALRSERGLNTDRNVDPGISRKRAYTPENNGVIPSKDGLLHHPV
ncbi:Hypothetical protein NGAL_HAMBI1146_07570 [Neorhizobium galegae bv. officinalis]|nr:Hypothetical protein NGAL_HAMBI1146_07570 [Neorhizobium galegae bv. officinalis]